LLISISTTITPEHMYAKNLKKVLAATTIRITLNRVEKIHPPLKEWAYSFQFRI